MQELGENLGEGLSAASKHGVGGRGVAPLQGPFELTRDPETHPGLGYIPRSCRLHRDHVGATAGRAASVVPAVRERRKLRERGMRLVPTVRPDAKRLHRDLQVLPDACGIEDVPPVEAVLPGMLSLAGPRPDKGPHLPAPPRTQGRPALGRVGVAGGRAPTCTPSGGTSCPCPRWPPALTASARYVGVI